MQKILGYMRKAIYDFDLIEDGDKIAVGVSGGKDSLVLLRGLCLLKKFIGIDYEVVAITLDPQFGGIKGNFDSIKKMCDELKIVYIIKETNIGQIVFDIRNEKHPCSLCARMRRGALNDVAKEVGCNKLALGHHRDDAIETFIMNLEIEGRIGCFSPKSYLSRSDITVIRPLVLAPEKAIMHEVRVSDNIKVVKSKCPADGSTKRQEIKDILKERERKNKGYTERIFGALRRSGIDGWGFKDK